MKYLWELVRRCPYCGSSTVRRSRRQNLFEAIALPLLLLRPYRCHACDLRHYSFVFTKRGQSASMQGNRDCRPIIIESERLDAGWSSWLESDACFATAERSRLTKKRKGRRAQKVLTVRELEKILRRAAKIS